MIRERKDRVRHVKDIDVLCPRIEESEMRPASEEKFEMEKTNKQTKV